MFYSVSLQKNGGRFLKTKNRRRRLDDETLALKKQKSCLSRWMVEQSCPKLLPLDPSRKVSMSALKIGPLRFYADPKYAKTFEKYQFSPKYDLKYNEIQ